MKFSYSLIKKFIPQLKSKAQVVEALTMHAFEAEDGRGDILEVSVSPNRYSDAASHWGIAKEAAAILNWSAKKLPIAPPDKKLIGRGGLKVNVQDKNLCPRYTAAIFENIVIKPSPPWLQKILKDCGLRPINNVVDIMNYVMLEVGQPLHAFDADKVAEKTIMVRKAKENEAITSIDGIHYKLTKNMLAIADPKRLLAIAGIKGGTGSEVTKSTKRIIIEAANFDSVSIYKTSRALNLITDASLRFSHDISPELARLGLERAIRLLEEIVGARPVGYVDSQTKPVPRRVLKFDIEKFNSLIGVDFSGEAAAVYLRRLGFKQIGGDKWEIPVLRPDIETHENLAGEVIRLFGINSLKPAAPHIFLKPSEFREMLVLKDRIRKFLLTLGLDEVYNNSFVSGSDSMKGNFWGSGSVELQNPISVEYAFLRPNLAINLLRNIHDNFRFFDRVRIFEIGHVFTFSGKKAADVQEKIILGIALGGKDKETFFELKGTLDEFLKSFGLTDFLLVRMEKSSEFPKERLRIESRGLIFGYMEHVQEGVSVAEIDLVKFLGLAEGETTFLPLPRYPAILRDVSILVSPEIKIGELIWAIQYSNLKLIQNVDLVDEYREAAWQDAQSITLRIVFQSEERTLTSEEVEKEMRKISSLLQREFGARVR